jgi:hypothetical protein
MAFAAGGAAASTGGAAAAAAAAAAAGRDCCSAAASASMASEPDLPREREERAMLVSLRPLTKESEASSSRVPRREDCGGAKRERERERE